VTRAQGVAAVLLSAIAAAAAAAPLLTPHSPSRQFADREHAPPMLPHVVYPDGRVGRPFVFPVRLVDRLERRYEIVSGRPVPIRWFASGTLASVDESDGPWLPLGGDPVGRDVFARLVYGARLSLGVAALAGAGAVLIGLLVGAPAGFFGGRIDRLLMAVADFILILPAIYVVLAIRAALPLVLATPQVFAAITLVLAGAGWPVAARGVRAIVAAERRKEYADAAYALGAHPLRILLVHMLPAAYPFLLTLWTMMVPGFVLAEATLSLVGLGFPVPTATWGSMLRDGWEGGAIVEAPWLLAPAGALVLTVFALHVLTSDGLRDRSATGTFQ
jgi:peptide/nickel transport system permease protein